MALYRVVTEITEQCIVLVEADDEGEAADMAANDAERLIESSTDLETKIVSVELATNARSDSTTKET